MTKQTLAIRNYHNPSKCTICFPKVFLQPFHEFIDMHF